MKSEKLLIGVAILFCCVLPIVGGNLFLYFLDRMPGYEFGATMFDYLSINGAMLTGMVVAYLFMRWRRNRKDKIPAVDERTLMVMKNYFLYVLYFVFILTGIILLVLFFLGVQSIEIGAIFAYISILIIIISAGALVATKV